ncbi:hypothetical protein HLB44_20675 [Aquincola sp. S2]|uniref:Uncharacterized protein n=1 Tax=Pseudaquabacterium terrae TaxID=2732868 RepID=A0ABX2ELE5_9BURK|nr:hypothetical protein [Aquabacterium terrae]NRF69419.1 hypothetical protein [Aquabacterium terrae]
MSATTIAAMAPIDAAQALNPATSAAGALAPHEPADPQQARRFAQLLAAPAGGSAAAAAGATDPAALREIAQVFGQQLEASRTLQEMRSSMLASVDLRDPIGTMFALTDHSLEAHAMFARLHISSGLASAATSLFGTLLKNQQ